MKKVEFSLPEWAFLEAECHLGNPLGERTVILHVRSASVIEIFDAERDDVHLYPDTAHVEYTLYTGERILVALHYCSTLDKGKDRKLIESEILMPCARFYNEYCRWEDRNIIDDAAAKLN